jgi:hypothetical protein
MLAKPLTSAQSIILLNRFNGWAERQGWAFMIQTEANNIEPKKHDAHTVDRYVRQHSVRLALTKTIDIVWPRLTVPKSALGRRHHKRRGWVRKKRQALVRRRSSAVDVSR